MCLFLPGVSIVLYGGEIGMENIPHIYNYARGPMQWDDTKYAGRYLIIVVLYSICVKNTHYDFKHLISMYRCI